MIFGLSWEVFVIIPILDVIGGCIGYILISVFIFHVNPFEKVQGKVGDYIAYSKYNKEGRKLFGFDVSVQEAFGLSDRTIADFDRAGMKKRIMTQDVEIKKLKERMKK